MSSAAFALPDRALVLDRYRPLKPLGRGGSGSVWLARDERTGLEVALKIVPREGKRAARAAREMEAASRLRHERCVRAYDFGGDAGHVYIAYEYVRGRTLRETLRSEDLDDAEAVEVAAQILDGLAHAHRNGIIHRDVKPSNVLVEESSEISVRVLDFGLAQFDEADTLTAVGDVPGTLAYISPERLGGEEASERSDVWAVGVILWEALAGSHPFWGVPLPQVATHDRVGGAAAVGPPRRPPAAPARRGRQRPLGRSRQASDGRPPRRGAPGGVRRGAPSAPDEPTPAVAEAHHEVASASGRAGPLARAASRPGRARGDRDAGRRLPPPVLAGLRARRARGRRRAHDAPRAEARPRADARDAPVRARERRPGGGRRLRSPRARLARGHLARRASRASLFCAGPLLAPLGLLALLPLAVQPARGAWRRALHAGVGVLAAAAVAGLSGSALPLGGGAVGDLGIAQSERPTDVLHAARNGDRDATGARDHGARAGGRRRPAAAGDAPGGHWGIAGLGALQLTLVLAWAPSIPWPGFVLGTWLLCGLLAARPFVAAFARERAR